MSPVAAGPLLRTSRLRLRDLRDADFDAVHAYASDPEVVRFMPWGPNSEQETHDFLDRAKEAAEADPRVLYELAVETAADGKLIGAAGLHLEGDHVAMLGYCYDRAAWGKGYATEAARALLGFGFGVLLVHRVWAGCDPDNVASARVLQKVGMTLEGHLREDTRIRGEFRDTLVFGMLAHEWRKENTP